MKAQIEYMEHDIMFQGERLHCEFGRYKDTNHYDCMMMKVWHIWKHQPM